MPETTHLKFSYQEVLECLIKQAGLHSGKWQLVFSFGITGANIGPNEKDTVPAAIVSITHMGLQKAAPQSPPALTADAAVVNPASST